MLGWKLNHVINGAPRNWCIHSVVKALPVSEFVMRVHVHCAVCLCVLCYVCVIKFTQRRHHLFSFSVTPMSHCPASRTTLVATRFWVVMICPIIKCLTVLEFSFILFDLCLFITIFNFILNHVPIVTFWIFTYHKIWILLIIFCFIWSYWIIYFLTSLEVFWSVVS